MSAPGFRRFTHGDSILYAAWQRIFNTPSPTEPSDRSLIKTVNLALQGGGSHGAFTWGVLDALLEDGRLDFDGISGTSAGAMNAVVLAHAMERARIDGKIGQERNDFVRTALMRFWDGVGVMGNFAGGTSIPTPSLMSWMTQWFSPEQMNPLNVNPLRRLLEREVDFDLLAAQDPPKVFVCATNIRTGRGEIFSGKKLSPAAVMASACLPLMFQPVQIDNEYYWDGGYSGNPAMHPLVYQTQTRDIVLIQINPIESPYKLGSGAQDILERVNEITFNIALLAEVRGINFIAHLLEQGRLDPKEYKHILLHRVDGGSMLAGFGANSKIRADYGFLHRLFELGREAGKRWIIEHFADLGERSSMKEIVPTFRKDD